LFWTHVVQRETLVMDYVEFLNNTCLARDGSAASALDAFISTIRVHMSKRVGS
jgi:hypothetical protein